MIDCLQNINWVPERDSKLSLEPEIKPLAKRSTALLAINSQTGVYVRHLYMCEPGVCERHLYVCEPNYYVRHLYACEPGVCVCVRAALVCMCAPVCGCPT
jgi:hypothetical protein